MDGTKQAKQMQEALVNKEGFLGNILQEFLQKLVQMEFERFIGAQTYERTDKRQGYRNGTYERVLYTRVGSIKMHISRDRAGEFNTQLFEKYQRSEKALVLSITEMYLAGVSTRKVSNIMEELCGVSFSKSQVSELSKSLDEKLKEWRERPLTEHYRYLVFDARYEKIRESGRIVSKGVVVAVGITEAGIREIIGCWVINSESYEAWDSCIAELKSRGLQGVEYVVSDENNGLRNALQKHFQGVILQRCQVHFIRNFISKLSKAERAEALRLLKDVFAATTKDDAMQRFEKVREHLLQRKKPAVAQWLEENIEDTLMVLHLPIAHHKKMKSTNMLERVNQELKRRSRVIRIFPNEQSCLRLLGSICQEMSELWGNRIYLNMEA